MPERIEHDPSVPPPAEVIHLPGPSYLPITLAFGAMVTLIGVLLTVVLVVIGLIIVVVVLFKWISSAREEMVELPLDHTRT
jgi:uncharacterized membrane protein